MNELILQSLSLYALAIVISFIVAVVIRGIVWGLSALEGREGAPKPEEAVSRSAPGPSYAKPADDIAAIAAAVYAVMGAHRIVRIQQARPAGWVAETRMMQQTSHSTRRR